MHLGARSAAPRVKPKRGNCEREDRHRRERDFPKSFRLCQTLAVSKRGQIAIHFRRRAITLLRILSARFDENVVELEKLLAIRTRTQLRIDLGKIQAVFAGADFVKKFAETKDVGLRRTGSFRRHVTFRTDE